jgi:hypothetical protein
MIQDNSPAQSLLSRVRSWSGVTAESNATVPMIRLKDHVIARFPSPDSLEVVLFGCLRSQATEDPEELPEGVWVTDDEQRLLVDLNAPGGMETAIRALMNAYLASQTPTARDWWLSPRSLKEDPSCEKTSQIIQRHRQNTYATR